MIKKTKGIIFFALCLLLGASDGAFAEDAEVKLDTNDGTTKFSVQDNGAATVFSADSDGNAYMMGYSSAARYYGDGSTLLNVSTHSFKIGDSYGGGKIFWVDAAGRQVLIAATADQSAGIKWSNNSDYTGANRGGVYAGRANTVIISTMQHAGSYAAQVCSDYITTTANGEYYDDWYLPSKEELSLLYVQKTVIGGFTDFSYWSSNEYVSISDAYGVTFSNGGMNNGNKANVTAVRCVRAGPSTAIGNLPINAESVTDGAYLASTQTFTGANTFKEVTAASATVTGEARIARNPVFAVISGLTLTAADFGKTITVTNAAAQTITLPSVTATDIGATITVVKLGAGRVTIQAAATTYIADSASGGTIYNQASGPAYASITLRLVTATQWLLVGGKGAWLTTD